MGPVASPRGGGGGEKVNSSPFHRENGPRAPEERREEAGEAGQGAEPSPQHRGGKWRLKTYLALPIPAPTQGAGSSLSSGKRKAGWGAAAAFSPEIASENDQTLHWESDDNLGPGSRSRGGVRGRSGTGHYPLPARQDLLILRSQGWRCHLGSGEARQSLSYPYFRPSPLRTGSSLMLPRALRSPERGTPKL